ncbi:PREDICTED: probable polygalacturonase At1g80170 [Erythranthe guttata]|uniref:probable polygalacturonase At1g80170 n=1 Tax=Erythranthe guttata TaxID=4155 RepID=UPI00064DADC3|nr:PREDICTED: probable polygalacturonase At1g80170 [Erythranthe guttata]|eukprot:XP_012856142.1 PREDICTED: probable polygalacturonase At1g80170 [Erythranthe guttata]
MSGAEIVIPEMKTYLVRPTDFVGPCRSKVTLRVSAIVYGFIVAPQDPEVWDGLDVNKWLYFRRVNRLNIEGAGGLINGMGHEWWARSCKKNESNPCTNAPTMAALYITMQAVTFDKCKNLKVINITIFNSQQTHIAFTHCKGVEASGIILMSSDSPSTNGVHISASTNVELDTITVSTGNECISIGSNSSAIRMKNIFCRLGHGISIGSLGKYNSSGIVEDVVLNRAFFFHTETGLRIKTWQKMQTSSVRIENVSYIGIRGTSATDEAIKFACSDSCPCKRLLLENIELTTFEWKRCKVLLLGSIRKKLEISVSAFLCFIR